MKMVSPPTMSVIQACKILGLGHMISSSEEIICAFRRKVRAAANDRGGYVRDMDDLTQAKEIVLAAYLRACEAAQKAEARRRAQAAEREEREALKKKKAREKTKPSTTVLLLSTKESSPYEAIRAFEQKREEACKAYSRRKSDDQMKKTVQTSEQERSPENDTLSLLQTCTNELERIRQREQEIAAELHLLQARRMALEQAVEKALALSEQMRTVLLAVVP